MQRIRIDGVEYEVPDAVAGRIQEYYDAAKKANDAANRLAGKVRLMREKQRDYFRTRQPLTLTQSKALEAEVDAMIAPPDRDKVVQGELYR